MSGLASRGVRCRPTCWPPSLACPQPHLLPSRSSTTQSPSCDLTDRHSISCAAIVAPRFQQASTSLLLGLPETTTVSALLIQPSPVVIVSTARSAPSVPSLPWRYSPNGRPRVESSSW